MLGKKGSDLNIPKLPKTHVIAQELLAHALFFILDALVVFVLPYDERKADVVIDIQNSTNITGWSIWLGSWVCKL